MYIEAKISLFRRKVKKSRVIEYFKARARFMTTTERFKDKKRRNIIAKVNSLKELREGDRNDRN